MANDHIPPPNSRDLLPPLLACLSTASASKQPPEALLPLLSPILVQRVRLLASDDWLSLLCWDKDVASRLPPIVNAIHLEPHPVSGEIELEEPKDTLYRRSDAETLHAKIVLPDLGLVVTYLWCTGGEGGNAWKLSDLRGLQDEDDGTLWFPTMSEANEAGLRRTSIPANKSANLPTTAISQPAPAQQQEDDDDDDDYWAAYDRTPGRTPARTPLQKRSPAPFASSRPNGSSQLQAEMDYFERYAEEVQPALDAHDPDEENPEVGESTLNGYSLGLHRETSANGATHIEALESFPPPAYSQSDESPHDEAASNGTKSNGTNGIHNKSPREEDSTTSGASAQESTYGALNHPRPSSPSSTSSVERLEREAEQSSQTEHAIKQHISTDMKSLFRLARSAGIDREEFERIIKRELEVLPLLEQDD